MNKELSLNFAHQEGEASAPEVGEFDFRVSEAAPRATGIGTKVPEEDGLFCFLRLPCSFSVSFLDSLKTCLSYNFSGSTKVIGFGSGTSLRYFS